MMVSDEEKRWLVVGIAMNKVAAPVLRNFIKQGMNTHYTNMDIYCSGLATPCTLKTLTYHQVSTDPCFKHLKFQNINNNLQLYGMKKKDLHKYNYNINSSVDLARLFLPDHLAEFSGFDNSLDMSAILRLLGFNNPAPIFHSPNPLISIQSSADCVRENVRNTWGHCNVTDWTEVFFNDCFSKLKTLVRGLGLISAVEKMVFDQLSDWETKGCQLCMGHAVDQNLLSVVQQDVKELVKNCKTTEESLVKQRGELTKMQSTVTSIQDQQSATKAQLEEYDDQLTAVLEWKEQQMKENKEIFLKLLSVEEMLTEELLIRVEGVEKGLAETGDKVQQLQQVFAETDDKVEQLQQGFAKTDNKVEQLQQGFAKTDDKVEQLQQGFARTDDKVEQLQQGFARTDDKVEQLQHGFAKTDDKVEQLQQGFAKTDDKVEQLQQGFARTDDKVEQLQQGFARTDDKVEQLQHGFAKTDDKVEQLQQGFAKTDDKVEQLQHGFAKTDDKVEQLQHGFAKTDDKVEQLQQGFAKTDDKVEQLQQGFAEVVSETGNKVKQLEEALGSQRMKENKPEACPADMFDVKTCQRKLAEHYQKTAKVPTTAWSSVLQVDLEQIYTRLSWVKQEQTTAGSSQKELNHYTDIFTEKTANGVVAKRILVQGETGIGKTTFVKKLLVDWSNLEEAKMDEERKDALRKFDLIVSVNLKEVSKCQTFKEVITRSRLFPEDDEKSVDDLLCYIRANQDKVLLVFDGYDEYCTGSEAEESFGSRSSSPIFEIFHGNIFRKCTILVTTRISRADEIRVFADMQAEITGFNMSDRKDFMRKMLVNETDVDGLLNFLRKSKLKDLARVPLLSLFFCLLWKEEKEKLMELTERKAELYQAIVKHILQHSHRRRSSPKASKLKETDYEEILAEIGKVALAGLLKGDLVFEFGQLPEKVRGEKAVIVGLFQFSEYGPSLQPTEMVSFIHKSIQEYLAAWYLIYSCVPKGSLGEIEQHALTLENCVALENVFQFVCGLSEEGAMKVLEHLKSVRISDLSKTIPDVETETDLPQCDFTDKHVRFSGLVYDSFQEVQSKADLLSPFFDCIGGSGIVCISRQRPLQKLVENVNALTKLAQDCAFFLHFIPLDEDVKSTVLYKSLEFLDCLRLPIRITEGSGVLKVEDFMGKWKLNRLNGHLRCFLSSIICFRKGQFQFYITELRLQCDDHARLFTKSTSINFPSDTGSVSSVQSCLKFLSCLRWYKLSPQTVKDLGAVIRNCNCLTTIEVEDGDDSICYLLQHLRNPRKCSVTIGASRVRPDVGVDLTSVGAGQLASLLPRFENLISLCLDLSHCDAAALVTLVSAITHETLEKLILSGISLTSSGAAALGRSLPEMSSLNVLELSGMDGSILEVEEMEALFGGFHKTLPLFRLAFRNFSSKGCLATLCKSFRLFPHLKELELEKLDINERDQCSLLESLRFLCDLTAISVQETDQQGYVHCYTTKSDRPGIQATLNLDGVRLTPAVAMALGRSLPEMSSLLELRLAGVDGSILQAEDMVALFGGLYKPLPLREFVFTGYCLRGCVSPLNKIFLFFPKVRKLTLEKLSMDENDQCGLLESLKLIPDLQNVASLRVNSKPPVHGNCCTAKLELTTSFFPLPTSKSLILGGISLTTKTSQSLGRFLPQMLSLTTLELTGVRDKSILYGEEIKALFGGFSRMLPLVRLVFSCFKLKGSVAPITNSFCFFPSLKWLELVDYNMDELSLCGLLESLRFLPNLRELIVLGRESGHPSCSTVGASKVCAFAHKALREFELTGLNLTPAVAAVLGQLLPGMSSLQSLCLRGALGNILQAEVIAACFGGFNKTLPLKLLFFSDFKVRGSLSPLTKSFRFFPNLEKLYLGGFNGNLSMDEHNLCALLESLRFMPNLKELSVNGEPLGDARCCTEEVNTLASFTHETLEQLKLDKISLAAVSAALLGRLLPGMSSLQVLELSGVDGSILEAEEMEVLLGGFNKTLPLYRLAFRNFSSRGCLASLCKSFGFFPSLKELELDRLNMNEHDRCSLLESLRFMPNLRALSIQSEHQEDVRCYTARMNTFSSFTLEDQKGLNFNGINLTQGAAAALGRSLPEMLSLQVLQLMGVKGNILLAETMESLFGRFHKTMALCKLTFSGFSVRGCLAPLIKSLRFFPSLRELRLEKLDIDEHDQCGLLKSFDGIIRDVTKLIVRETGKECLNFFYYTSRFYTVDSVTHGRVTRRLELDGFSLTSSIATLLGRLLPEMSSLQSLELTGMHRGMLKAEEMEALFGGFSTTLPLYELTLRSLSARGCLAPLFKSLNFFPNLIELHLGKLNMDEHDLRGLLESFQFIPNLQELNLSDNPLGHAVTSIVPHVIHLKKLRYLYVLNTGSSEEDLNYVRDTVQQALPELRIRTGLLTEL